MTQSTTTILRDYQQQAIDNIRSAFFERELNRLLVVQPTGSGKTVVFSHLLRDPAIVQWMAGFPVDKRRVLVLAHRNVLKVLGGDDLNTSRDVLVVGFTATPKRGDAIGLQAVFQEIVDSRSLVELIDNGTLSDLRAYRILTGVNLDVVKTQSGDFREGELASAVNIATRNAAALKAYADFAADRQAIVFCVNVSHATALDQKFRSAGIPTAVVHGGMAKQLRRARCANCRDAMATGQRAGSRVAGPDDASVRSANTKPWRSTTTTLSAEMGWLNMGPSRPAPRTAAAGTTAACARA